MDCENKLSNPHLHALVNETMLLHEEAGFFQAQQGWEELLQEYILAKSALLVPFSFLLGSVVWFTHKHTNTHTELVSPTGAAAGRCYARDPERETQPVPPGPPDDDGENVAAAVQTVAAHS